MKTRWIETDRGDQRCRELADRHYTRRKVGDRQWTRPGWNQVLYAEQRNGRSASFVWWRPKWESGLPGTERQDKLRAIECALFRNETRYRSSDLIEEALGCLQTWEHALDVEWPDGIITGISSAATAGGRHPDHEPGYCFREAGFEPFDHGERKRVADVWLRFAGALPPPPIVPARSERLIALRDPNARQLVLPEVA